MNLNLLFWSPITQELYDYWALNFTLKTLDRYLLIGDPTIDQKIWDFSSQVFYKEVTENHMLLKGNCALKTALQWPWDFLVKIDIDTLLLNKKLLEEKLLKYKGEVALIGNRKKFKKREPNRLTAYIRGGCQAFSRELVEQLVTQEINFEKISKYDLDYYFAMWFSALQNKDKKLIAEPLFDIGPPDMKLSLPAWHPERRRKKKHFFEMVQRTK